MADGPHFGWSLIVMDFSSMTFVGFMYMPASISPLAGCQIEHDDSLAASSSAEPWANDRCRAVLPGGPWEAPGASAIVLAREGHTRFEIVPDFTNRLACNHVREAAE